MILSITQQKLKLKQTKYNKSKTLKGMKIAYVQYEHPSAKNGESKHFSEDLTKILQA